jgi:hypothetical protein
MNNADMDKLLEQGLSGEPPREEFRERVLRDSLVTFARARRTRVRRRAALLAAAAVVIAGASFVLGRYSWPQESLVAPPVSRPAAADSQGVTVPSELVQWVEAARLFRQLGMEDRMARAVDHASKLVPYDTATGAVACGSTAPGGEGGGIAAAGAGATRISDVTSGAAGPRSTILSALGLVAPPPAPGPLSDEHVNPILAHSLGD